MMNRPRRAPHEPPQQEPTSLDSDRSGLTHIERLALRAAASLAQTDHETKRAMMARFFPGETNYVKIAGEIAALEAVLIGCQAPRGPMNTTEIARHMMLSRKMVDAYLKRLINRGLITKIGRAFVIASALTWFDPDDLAGARAASVQFAEAANTYEQEDHRRRHNGFKLGGGTEAGQGAERDKER